MFFSGDYRSKKSINLSGASRTKTKDELIREANIEREKRERDKKQAQAAVKIQSAYRSYLSRKALKIEYRRKINERFEDILRNCINQSQNQLQIPDDFNTYFKYFVQTFDVKYDLDRLLKLSQFILQKKESFIRTIIQDNKNFTYTFAKFLKVNLTVLNKSNINHSICLRLIDYFTLPSNYKTEESDDVGTVVFIFEYLIKHGYVNELTRYSLAKIPPNVDFNATNYPIVQSISDLFFRVFVYLDFNNETTNLSSIIVKSLCEHLFAKAYKSQIRYAIIERLAQLFPKQDKSSYSNMTKTFLNIFATLNDSNTGFDNANNYYTVDIFSSYVKNLCILYSLLKLYQYSIDKFTNQQFRQYMNVVSQLISRLPVLDESDQDLLFTSFKGIDLFVITAGSNDYDDYSEYRNKCNKEKSEVDMEVDDEENENSDKRRHATSDEYNAFTTINLLSDEIFKLIDSRSVSNKLFTLFNTTNFDVDDNENRLFSSNISQICYYMIVISKIKAHQSNFLRTLSFNSKSFIYHLWKSICLLSVKPNENQQVYLVQLLASGSSIELYDNTLCKIVAPLTTFCSLYNLYLLPILDVEFLSGEAIFSKTELIDMCSLLKDICLGIIHLMHPDTRPILTTLFNKKQNNEITELDIKLKAIYFTHLFKACSQLVQRMYTRDIRAGFCPEDHWLSNIISVTANRFVSSSIDCINKPILTLRFGHLSYLFQDKTELVHSFSVNDVRALTVLQELPFTVPFSERVALFEHFIRHELEHDPDNVLRVRIRRSRLLEDAFQNLSLVNAPNLKKQKVTVEMENVHGLDEAGIDGGGVFREFLLELLKSAFDPQHVFFMETADGCLYPNPQSRSLDVILEGESANRQEFYFFVGRMLAKAIQSKLLCDIKLAGFFLQKILSKYSDSRLDIDYLASMDPVIYKSLMELKNEKEDEKVEKMDLTFSVDVEAFGVVKTVEFKPNGKDIKVTNENKIEFMHLMADYKLNKQINEQVAAFRNGMANIIDLEYLRLFNFNELQNLISGPDHIDVNDWKQHTVYGNGFDEYDEVIKTFWRIVEDFTEEQRKQLLKFATSRSRAPLFGFKNIIPNFAIHNSFDTDRLPTANTCFNLLKLPPIEDYDLLKEKLLKSIEANAGFEYS